MSGNTLQKPHFGGRMRGNMKNPLWRRLPREFRGEFGKYLVIFLFMAATIGFISGFLVADGSMIAAYEESFGKYRIEDGNFELANEAEAAKLAAFAAKEGIRIYPLFYVEKTVDAENDAGAESTLRIFWQREQVDLVDLLSGEAPGKADEIAIDRLYARNNQIKVGDVVKVGERNLTVSGLVALSDYSALFSDNGDLMFDSVLFGVGVMTQEGYAALGDEGEHYRYAWEYDVPPEGEAQEKERAEELMGALAKEFPLTAFLPQYLNQAIHFTGDDMGGDRNMMLVLLYILILILAFVFAVTTNNTIAKEAAVIGTLRASGYKKGELLRHYIALQLLVSLLAAIVGNLSGYTVFRQVGAWMYYNSYSLPSYRTRWGAQAFVLTTVIPLLLVAAVNGIVVSGKLSLSPLKLLRRDLARRQKKKALRLPHYKFFTRFRIRIILQNMSGYVTLFFGILFADVLLLFGMMMGPILDHYQEGVTEHMAADYQYILKAPTEAGEQVQAGRGAEKYAVASLKLADGRYPKEEVSVYGIVQGSAYFGLDFLAEGVFISDAYAEKYGVKKGDTICLKEQYNDTSYEFRVGGIYAWPFGICVFLPQEEFAKSFGHEAGYFNGYFSDVELTGLNPAMVASVITQEDLTKVSRQLDKSMGSMFYILEIFAVLMFLLLIYLLTKLIVEKNAPAISMVKILGYKNREISSLYLNATTWMVVLFALAGIGLSTLIIRVIYRGIMIGYPGWLPMYIAPWIYPAMFAVGMAAYGVVALLQFKKIKAVPMDEALKNIL